MNNTICLDASYSTTRIIVKEKPNIVNNTQDKFETVLLLPEGGERQGEGGLRAKGYFKQSYESKPLISIITVVYNGKKYLEETIHSVINQTYDNVEYIIIDGGSTDGTLDIIRKYENQIDYWISERDHGIYDAMNKGITLASGEWINFMNAGDIFYNTTVIKEIFLQKIHYCDIIYGHHEVRYPNKKRIAVVGQMKDLWKGSQFSHQSAFISSHFHINNKFNITNRIGADFEFFYNSYKNGVHFKFVDIIISSISSGGLSDIMRIDSIVGAWNVVKKDSKTNVYYIYLILKEMLKYRIKNIVNHIKGNF